MTRDPRWFVRRVETSNGEMFLLQTDKSTWGPFNTEDAAWSWLDEGAPDERYWGKGTH